MITAEHCFALIQEACWVEQSLNEALAKLTAMSDRLDTIDHLTIYQIQFHDTFTAYAPWDSVKFTPKQVHVRRTVDGVVTRRVLPREPLQKGEIVVVGRGDGLSFVLGRGAQEVLRAEIREHVEEIGVMAEARDLFVERITRAASEMSEAERRRFTAITERFGVSRAAKPLADKVNWKKEGF